METSITIAILAGFLGHPASSIQLQNPSQASRAGSSRFAVWFFHNVFHCFPPRTELIVLFLVGDSLGLCLLFWFIILCSFKVFFVFFGTSIQRFLHRELAQTIVFWDIIFCATHVIIYVYEQPPYDVLLLCSYSHMHLYLNFNSSLFHLIETRQHP